MTAATVRERARHLAWEDRKNSATKPWTISLGWTSFNLAVRGDKFGHNTAGHIEYDFAGWHDIIINDELPDSEQRAIRAFLIGYLLYDARRPGGVGRLYSRETEYTYQLDGDHTSEREIFATEYAGALLLPAQELVNDILYTSVYEVSEKYDVPLWFLKERLENLDNYRFGDTPRGLGKALAEMGKPDPVIHEVTIGCEENITGTAVRIGDKDMKIHAGIRDGELVRVGDTVMRVFLKAPEGFTLHGSRLVVETPVPFRTCIFGGKVKVPMLDGSTVGWEGFEGLYDGMCITTDIPWITFQDGEQGFCDIRVRCELPEGIRIKANRLLKGHDICLRHGDVELAEAYKEKLLHLEHEWLPQSPTSKVGS